MPFHPHTQAPKKSSTRDIYYKYTKLCDVIQTDIHETTRGYAKDVDALRARASAARPVDVFEDEASQQRERDPEARPNQQVLPDLLVLHAVVLDDARVVQEHVVVLELVQNHGDERVSAGTAHASRGISVPQEARLYGIWALLTSVGVLVVIPCMHCLA